MSTDEQTFEQWARRLLAEQQMLGAPPLSSVMASELRRAFRQGAQEERAITQAMARVLLDVYNDERPDRSDLAALLESAGVLATPSGSPDR